MIDFHRIQLEDKQAYEQILMNLPARGCEYSFANLYLWGRQQIAFLHGCAVFFSHYDGKSIYPYPIGTGDKKAVLEAVLSDARERGIPCRLAGITLEEEKELEELFPGAFHFEDHRDFADYVYLTEDLADLRGRKLQRKRNHVNRFRAMHPDYSVVPLTSDNLPIAQKLVEDWYAHRMETTGGDFLMEQVALDRTFRNFEGLQMEGILLYCGEEPVAMTMASRMAPDMLDVHFEKAREDVDGAYAAVNSEFARYIRLKYPEIQYLDREDDMGLEGLRKAKLSYHPHHIVEKRRAYLVEEIDDPSLS